jgi:hypothetical protein
MVKHLNVLWQAANTASVVGDFARQSQTQTYVFRVQEPTTVYIRAEQTEVRVMRWNVPQVEITLQLQAAFGWRTAAEQDDAGVYVVAKRRPLLGAVSSAVIRVIAPHDAYLLLKLENGRVLLDEVWGTLRLPPFENGRETPLLPAGRQG